MIKIAMAMSALGLALAAPAAPAHLKSDANPEDDAAAPAPAAPAFNPFPGSYPNPNQWNTPWGPSAPANPSQTPAWASANGPYSGAPAPIYSPNSQFNPYNPVYNPYTTAAYPQSNPMHPQWGHPAYNPYHPLNNPWHPANAFPAYPSYEQGAQEAAQASFVATESKSKAKSGPADNNGFSEAQQNWSNYFAGPTSEYTWPGAPEAAPGVHPTLGGKLNPFNPLGAPSHPYPFPMHQGLKNGARHPRPFTATGQYYPGQSEIPPQFFPNPFGTLGYPGAFPYGFQAPTNYFPAAKNGRIQ